MQKSDLALVGAILLILGAVEIIGLILAGATSHDVAAWVEALGVLAAFVASIYLARRAEHQARLLRLADAQIAMTKRLQELDGLVFKIQSFTNTLPAWVLLATNDRIGPDDARIQEAVVLADLMNTVQILGLPDFALVSVLGSL